MSLSCRVRRDPEEEKAETVLVNVGKALAAYEETLVTGRTPFDDFRDRLTRGEASAGAYPAAARRGLKVFVGREIASRVTADRFTDRAFRERSAAVHRADHARHRPIRGSDRTSGEPFSLKGPTTTPARRRGRFEVDRATAPGGAPEPAQRCRDGTVSPQRHAASLYDVVRRYAKPAAASPYVDDEHKVRRVELSAQDVDDLVAFSRR